MKRIHKSDGDSDILMKPSKLHTYLKKLSQIENYEKVFPTMVFLKNLYRYEIHQKEN